MPQVDPLQTVLDKSPLSRAQKADLWDAYHNAADADALVAALTPINIPKPIKAQLWDLKSAATPTQRAITGPLEQGNIDLRKQPRVKNPDGTTSTVDSRSYNFDGKEYLLPSVTPDGRHLQSDDEIVAEFKKTGRHLGIFDSPESATAYAQQLHEDYAAGKYEPERTYLDTAKDLGAGFAKAAGRSVQFVADDVPHFFRGAGLSDYIDMATGRKPGTTYHMASEGLQSKNPTQTVGGLVETAAEFGLGGSKAASTIPTTAKAGEKFQQVMSAARNLPVDVNAPGQVAFRIQELAERGGSMPMAVRKFVNYVTDPQKPAMTYEVARDFASNISRLSANEFQRLTPVVAREVAELRVALNKSIADVANKAGKGREYAQAMTEYARAMRIRNAIDSVIEGAKKGLPYATAGAVGAGASYWLTSKIRNLIGSD